ncbi:MAG: heme exporter protein CcmD [Pseudomonadota bacterium]
MEIVTDFGAHGRYIWPAYAAFAVIFIGLVVWAWRGSVKTRAGLERLERETKR